jgi:hypothetical protein
MTDPEDRKACRFCSAWQGPNGFPNLKNYGYCRRYDLVTQADEKYDACNHAEAQKDEVSGA